MTRTTKDYVIISLKGMAMGAADVVPGVSGGTIAFISGIYEELLTSIANINFSLLKIWKEKGIKAMWTELNGSFLATLFLGIGISVLSLAKGIKWMLENEPVLLWSFFFGLVLASIIYVGKQITTWGFATLFFLIIGALVAFYITTLTPMVNENSSPWFLFLAGAIAICAMILPGISGAFILVLLGAYKPVLDAVNSRDVFTICVVGLGALFGLLSFSRLLKWFFNKFKNVTLAVLTGFIIGSLNKIWPWKETISWRINSKGVRVPLDQTSISPFSFEGDPKLIWAVLMGVLGFALILLLERLAIDKKNV